MYQSEAVIGQIGGKLSDFKKVKLYLACFNDDMQRELKFVGAADAKTKRQHPPPGRNMPNE